MLIPRIIFLSLALMACGCSASSEIKTFANESGLGLCPGVIVTRPRTVKPPSAIDYIYNAKLYNIGSCRTLTQNAVEREGYICQKGRQTLQCYKVFDDGSIGRLTWNGDTLDLKRQHNK